MNDPLPEKLNDIPTNSAPPEHPEVDRENEALEEKRALIIKAHYLHQQGRRGSNWFYWVGALSLVNSLIMLNGGNTFFVIGLGITLMVDVLGTAVAKQSPEIAQTAKIVAFALDVFIALLVAGFGWLAGKRYRAVFALGMVLYLLDGLLFVLFQDWMSVGFHAFALFCMWTGFRAYQQLDALEADLQQRFASNPERPPMLG